MVRLIYNGNDAMYIVKSYQMCGRKASTVYLGKMLYFGTFVAEDIPSL